VEKHKEIISRALGIEIAGFSKKVLNPNQADYTLQLKSGKSIPIGGVKEAMEYESYKEALFLHCDHICPDPMPIRQEYDPEGRDYPINSPAEHKRIWEQHVLKALLAIITDENAISALDYERQEILGAIMDGSNTPKTIASALDKNTRPIKKLLTEMLKDGQVEKIGRNKYTISSAMVLEEEKE